MRDIITPDVSTAKEVWQHQPGVFIHYRGQMQDQLTDIFEVTTVDAVNRTALKDVFTPVHTTVYDNVEYAVYLATYVEATHRELNE